MIVQGTAHIGKSFLITCIKEHLASPNDSRETTLLLLAPTGVATFNINASIIHASLHIPVNDFHPLEGNALANIQEELIYIRYVLIDEMSFLGPSLFNCIDEHLRESFPEQKKSISRVAQLYWLETLANCHPLERFH